MKNDQATGKLPQYEEIKSHVQTVDPEHDHAFIASFSAPDDNELEIIILDSYHQGVTITLKSDGTYAVCPTGG